MQLGVSVGSAWSFPPMLRVGPIDIPGCSGMESLSAGYEPTVETVSLPCVPSLGVEPRGSRICVTDGVLLDRPQRPNWRQHFAHVLADHTSQGRRATTLTRANGCERKDRADSTILANLDALPLLNRDCSQCLISLIFGEIVTAVNMRIAPSFASCQTISTMTWLAMSQRTASDCLFLRQD